MIGLFSHLTKSTICAVEINIMFTAHIHTHKHTNIYIYLI